MDAEARVQRVSQPGAPLGTATGGIDAGASVVLLRPRRLRGTIGVVRRPVPGGWEVEIRSALGTPMHLTLPEQALHLR